MIEGLKWMVQHNPMSKEKPYRVYRRRTMDQPLHSGNMEYGSDFMGDKKEAQAIADRLNQETICVAILEPKGKLELREIKDELAVYQQIVKGSIEMVGVSEGVAIICNEEGRLRGLERNAMGFVGTIIFVGINGENFRGLTDREVNYCRFIAEE